MKVFDSGMPEEAYWNSLFDIPRVIDWLGLDRVSGPVIEIGCGYGTFTLPVAKAIDGEMISFDIDVEMAKRAGENVQKAGRTNVTLIVRDVLDQGTGLDSDSVGMVLLFNILHSDDREKILKEACRILKPAGIAAIIHWRKDIPTPRGPRIETRPDETMIRESIAGLDFRIRGKSVILEPYHWGMQLIKRKKRL